MKKIRLILVAVVAVVALVAAAGLRRVPEGYEALRLSRDGATTRVGTGWHIVGPGSELVRFPVGDHSFRVPSSGSVPVIFQNGDSLAVALRADLTIPAASIETIYSRFSRDFAAAVSRLVVSAAEIEAASSSAPSDPAVFARAVDARVGQELSALGITVRSLALAQWGERSFEAGPEAARAALEPIEPVRRVVIVGVDGGDWLNLRPLMEAGRLPNFARLARDGATGPLRSEEPMLSPLLWTTMATGRYPEDHGILNFTVVDEQTGARVPISRLYRRVDAFWNMLSGRGQEVAVIGWLATDPAEDVRGLMVTDKFGYLAYAPGDTSRADATAVFPPARAAELAAHVVHSDTVTDDEIARFVHLPRAEIARHRGSFDPHDSVNNLIHLYASTLTFRNLAVHVLKNDRPDLLAVYFEWVDAMGHLFMLHAPPRMPDVPADEYERFKDAVEQAYVLQDEALGAIMDALDDETVLMVISDHGFKSGTSRLSNRPEIWAGNAAKWHRLDGIVALYGAGVRKGATIDGATILDVTPTVLALMGLPRASDMPGKPMAGAFEAAVVASFSAEQVPTLDRPRTAAAGVAAADPGASAEAMKKLEALGYLTPDNADAHNNLGQRYQQRGEFEKAIDAYQQAIAMRPGFHSAYNNLAVCYGKLKRYPEAEEALRKCIALKPDDFYAMNNLAVMLIETGRVDDGMAVAEQAVATEPGYANGRVTLGSAYAMRRRFDDAERQFQEALRLDPENQEARTNLQRIASIRGGQ